VTGVIRGACVFVVLAFALPASAQSLADVAKQEEARRTTTPKAVKSYSNADLKPSDLPPPAPAVPAGEPESSCYMSSSLDKCVTAEELLTRVNDNTPNVELAKEEDGWRRSAEQIRKQAAKFQSEIAAYTEVADDESRSPGERGTAEAMLARKTASLRTLQERWTKLEKDAEYKRIPHKWLEPAPVFELDPPEPQ
jgi:hypothetical protein